MISRWRETGFLEVCSWGACLEDRLGLGSSFDLVGFRGAGVVSVREDSVVCLEDFERRDEDGREAWAFARAPKEIEERSTLGACSSG
jgi:hypothetical protein